MDTPARPTCVIADDHDIVLQGLKLTLGTFADVLGTASNGYEAVSLTRSLRPDVLFLDIRMPGPGLVGVLDALRDDSACDTRVLVFSSLSAVERVKAAFEAGAHGYLSKDAALATIQAGVEAVIGGQRFLDPVLAPAVLGASSSQLTARECQTLQLMAAGAQNAGIAMELDVSEETVKSHVSNILRKLDSPSRTGAVAQALRDGVVD